MAENNDKTPNKRNRNNKKIQIAIAALFVCCIALLSWPSNPMEEIDNDKFLELIKNGHIKSITLNDAGVAHITLKEEIAKQTKNAKDNIGGPHYSMKTLGGFQYNYHTNYRRDYPHAPELNYRGVSFFHKMLGYLPMVIQMVLYLFFLLIISAPMLDIDLPFKRKKGQLWDKQNKTGVRFTDVQGMAEAKRQLSDVVDYYKHPSRYHRIGAKPFKGALLAGPPGTGKTLLAKALAGEAEVSLISICGSQFDEIFVGSGSQRIRTLFEQARKMAPCVIFIDEIDAIGRKRATASYGQASHEQTLNQLLNEIDGFNSTTGIFVLASTNHPNLLDPALVRPGRLGLRISTNYPTKKERVDTFVYYLNKMNIDKTAISMERLAEKTPGSSYADIDEICNLAGLLTARKNQETVTNLELDEAIAQKIGGIKRYETILTTEEKYKIAIHEIGHAFVAHCLLHADPLVGVNIMPRTNNVLGFAQYLPSERSLVQKSYLLDKICTSLGGRAAEEIFFGEPSTGAQNDLEYVTKMAYAMVTIYGMNDTIGKLSYYDSTTGGQYTWSEPYSQETKSKIDHEVRKLVDELYEKVKQIILKYRDVVQKVAELLAQKEELSAEEFQECVGPRDTYLIALGYKKENNAKKEPVSPKEQKEKQDDKE